MCPKHCEYCYTTLHICQLRLFLNSRNYYEIDETGIHSNFMSHKIINNVICLLQMMPLQKYHTGQMKDPNPKHHHTKHRESEQGPNASYPDDQGSMKERRSRGSKEREHSHEGECQGFEFISCYDTGRKNYWLSIVGNPFFDKDFRLESYARLSKCFWKARKS